MINAQDEEVRDELEANDTDDATQDIDSESDESTEESGGEEVSEDTVQVSRAEYEKLRRESAAAKRLREKAQKGSEPSKESSSGLDHELIYRTYLAAQAGITDTDVQDEALRLADKFGISIAEAMKDPDITTRVKNLQKQKETQKAIAKSTGGSSAKPKDVTYYLTYFKQNGDFPAGTPNSMIAKVAELLD